MARPPAKKRIRHSAAEPERPSRSARKRASAAMQKLGEEIARLRPADREELDLPEALQEALAMYDRIRGHEGKRRQRQYIGRLMRDLDADAIARALRKFQDTETHRIDWIPIARQEMEDIIAARDEKARQLVAEFLEDMTLPQMPEAIPQETAEKMLALAKTAREEEGKSPGNAARAELFRLMADLLPR